MNAPRLHSGTLLIATRNGGKLREMGALLAPYGVPVRGAAALRLAPVEETGRSFAENAALKARSCADESGMAALGDDSGLCVDALDGAPGIHSAGWAGRPRDFARACARLEEELQKRRAASPEERRAHFICALAFAEPSGRVQIFEGRVEGHIVWPPQGANGFGYDPIFMPRGFAQTFGEMPPAQKEAISHRARAFALFAKACLTKPAP